MTQWFTYFIASLSLLIKLKIKSHSFSISFFFLLLTFDGGGGFCNYFDLWKIKLRRVGFSVSHLSLIFFFHSFTLTSLTLTLTNLFYTLTLFTLVINSIELIWTSPFQKYSLSTLVIQLSPGHVSHLSLSLTFTCDWEWMCHMTWAFFLSLFSITSWACEWSHHHSEWVSEN